ncbi:expressed unknown protein [Seminavis robusta]|uniref:Uncharacterized protein n=1 Tax=Seminavis robusta TaxID=568900 RepID=A0A9N8HWN2_9STRA|nr:expressed unknown protein [Seminavis robusta]|eukprot:Sro2722_g335560.1 n/a (347) ;mRNA; r:4030-5070
MASSPSSSGATDVPVDRSTVSNSTSSVSSVAATQPQRRSSRRSNAGNRRQSWMDVAFASPPWGSHYKDIGHCRFAKCTKRIQNATDTEIANLPKSHLADAISASTAYTPKGKHERLLMDYTRALLQRNIDPNDLNRWQRSAVSCAAYHGYPKLLKLLIVDANCSVTLGTPHALIAAVENGQHECMTILLEHRKEELLTILNKEENDGASDKMIRGKHPESALEKTVARRDVTSVQILRDQGNTRMSDSCYWYHRQKVLPSLLQAMYDGHDENILAWSKCLHWSFPTTDRRMINYIWHLIAPNSDFPKEVWLNILSFMGRGWWMDASSSARRSISDVREWNVIDSTN